MHNRICHNRANHNRMFGGTMRSFATLVYQTDLAERLNKYLRVTPEEPQQIVWAHDGMQVTYDVESNTNWKIE